MATTLTLGLAPALSIEETIRFGPLTLTPVSEAGDPQLAKVAERYAEKRGASTTGQAVVTCPDELRPIVPTVWPLFVFACVSFARREEGFRRGVPFPESFHLLHVTPTGGKFIYDTGQGMGIGEPSHIPLRWPVDSPAPLMNSWWDRRIETACTLLAKDPTESARNAVANAAGMAADLANAAMERRSQRVENVATGARTYVMLGSAFEALHRKRSDDDHRHARVYCTVDRLDPGATSLGKAVFSRRSLRPSKTDGASMAPKPKVGDRITRPVFVVAHLFHLRNRYAHGRNPSEADWARYDELNQACVMHAATMILATLIGDDLLGELGCTLSDWTPALSGEASKHGVSFDLLNRAFVDGQSLLRHLEEAIVPADECSPRRPPEGSGTAPMAPEEGGMAYVTARGTRYHRAGCIYLRKSCRPVSLAQAVKSYERCGACEPPE